MWVAVLCSLILEAFFTLCIWGMVSWRLYSDWSRIIRMADDKVITNQFHFPPLIFSIHLWNVITYCMSYSYITDTWLHIAYSYTDMWLHIARPTPSSRRRDYILYVLLNLHRNVITYCTSYFLHRHVITYCTSTPSSRTRDYIFYVLLLLHRNLITYCMSYSFFAERAAVSFSRWWRHNTTCASL